MLSVDEARTLAANWRGRFADEAAFEQSWTRYFETATVPDRGRLEAWLGKDLAKDAVLHAGIVKEPLLPTHSRFNPGSVCELPGNHEGPHQWSDSTRPGCYHCGGKRYVRRDVPVSHPEFGKAFPCPDCNR